MRRCAPWGNRKKGAPSWTLGVGGLETVTVQHGVPTCDTAGPWRRPSPLLTLPRPAPPLPSPSISPSFLLSALPYKPRCSEGLHTAPGRDPVGQARDPHFPTRHAEAGGRHVPRARDPLPRGDFRPATCGPPPVLWRPELDLECQVHVSCFLAWSGEGPRSQGFGDPQAQQAKATSPFISKLALDILGPLRDHGMGDP